MLQRFLKYLFKNQVVLALFLICFGWFVFQIREIIVSVFLSYIIMAAVLPIVNYLIKNRFPRLLAVLIPYVWIFLSIFLIVLPLVPFVISQIQTLITGLPYYLNRSAGTLGFNIDPSQVKHFLSINSQLDKVGANAFLFTSKLFGGLFFVLTVFIVSFYLLLYHDSFKKSFARLFQSHRQANILKTLDQVNDKLGAWLRGQVILCLFIGFLSWIGLSLIGVPDPLPLALLAGILEIVPTLGPILSAIPAIIVALTISPSLAVIVIGLYIVIQAIENNFLVPKVMERAVGLNPVVVILSIMIGANLMGIIGALLAIPFISLIIVIFQSLEMK